MNVIEMKELLKDLPDKMEIVTIGHFGEAIKFDTGQIYVHKGPNVLVDTYYDCRNGVEIEEDVLDITSPSHGEEPD